MRSVPAMIVSVRCLVTIVVAVCLVATSCGSETAEPLGASADSGDAATTDTTPTTTGAVEPASEETSGSPEPSFSWQMPDEFDATFGDGSLVLQLAALLPELDALPPEWIPLDTPAEDEPSCVGVEPEAALQTGWLVPPVDPAMAFPNIVIINLENHGDEAGAAEARATLGSDEWVTCQRALFDGASEDGVSITSDNPEGFEIASPIDRPSVEARRQLTITSVFGSEMEVVAETHVWNEGPLLYVISVVSGDESHSELVQVAADRFGSGDASWSTQEQDLLDEGIPLLRRAIERDDSQLPFFDLEERAQFRPPVPTEFQDCATATTDPALTIMNGPVWLTPSGASVVIQGGLVMGSANDAVAELERYEAVGADCLVERAGPLLGDFTVERVSVDRVVIDGIEVLLADADMTQLASNDFVATDIAVVAQRTYAVSGSRIVGFGFIGIAGDEPDLLALTAAAVKRMGE